MEEDVMNISFWIAQVVLAVLFAGSTARSSLELNIVGGRNYQRLPVQQNDALFVAVAQAILAKLP
jgi:hypothetical protein